MNSSHSAEDKSIAEQLIDVAGQIFATKGPAATVREICGAAGCSVAAVNYYFGDKQQLYLRCVQTAAEQKQRLFPLPKADDAASAEQLLRMFLRAMAARIAGKANLTWHNNLMLREVLAPSPATEQLLADHFRSDFKLLDDQLGRLLGRELDSPMLRNSLATQILARCMFLRTGQQVRQMLEISSERNEDPQLYADEISDSILMQISTLRTQLKTPEHGSVFTIGDQAQQPSQADSGGRT